MATDIKLLIKNLLEFYNFENKSIISIGAGGGQLIEYGRHVKHVTAIDNDEVALRKLKQNLIDSNLDDKFTLVHSDFYLADFKADLLLFEFCLHEMNNPEAAIRHAHTMASDVIIADHWPGSEWIYFGDEDEKTAKSWKAIESFQPKCIRKFDTVQVFKDYQELYQRVYGQGGRSIKRIGKYKEIKNISIPMSYAFALV